MVGWVRNSKIAAVLIIEITTILLFHGGDEITTVLINSPLLFPTNNPNNISTIRNSFIFLLSSC
jgi:TRAP-type C4-dicarboxylate transport system permease large subunit